MVSLILWANLMVYYSDIGLTALEFSVMLRRLEARQSPILLHEKPLPPLLLGEEKFEDPCVEMDDEDEDDDGAGETPRGTEWFKCE